MALKKTLLATIGMSALVAGCNMNGATTKTASNGVRGDVTDVRPVEPVQAAYQPPVYDTSAPIPTVRQPLQPVAAVSNDTTVTPMISTTPDKSIGGKSTHTVRKGETLFSIAKASYGDGKQWKKLVAANPGVSPSKLKVGQVILVPS